VTADTGALPLVAQRLRATRAAGSSEPDCSRIFVTIEISDPETVKAYADVDDALVFADLRDGTLMQMAQFVSRKNDSVRNEEYPRRTGSIFEQCVRHIRGLDKRGLRKLRRDANAMFGKGTRIVLPGDSDNAGHEARRQQKQEGGPQ